MKLLRDGNRKMKLVGKGIAAFAAVAIFSGCLGCSAVNGTARQTADSYIDALLAMDTVTCDSLSADGASGLTSYMKPDYKIRAVELILNATHYRYEPFSSGRGDEGSRVFVYTLVMPDINASIASHPTDSEEFQQFLGTKGKSDVTVSVSVKKIDGVWAVINSDEIAQNLYGSLFTPGYEFMLDGSTVLLDPVWTSSAGDDCFNDVTDISCHYRLSDEYAGSGVSLDLTYEYYKDDELICSGLPVYDDDGAGLSFPLDISDTDLDYDYLPEFDYRLVIYNLGNEFYEDHQSCTLSPILFPNGSAVDEISWQYTDRSGIYFNRSDIIAKVWLDPRYIGSGRPLDLTFDIFCDGELISQGQNADIYDNIAICTYEDEILRTGSYAINVYNNGTLAGSSVTSVILNLDPDKYTELAVPDSVTDENTEARARLEICTGSRNAMDIAYLYTDVDYTYTTVSMNIFEQQMDQILASGENAPDMIICDSAHARRYAMSDMTIPLNDIGISYSELQYMYEYTFALATDEDSVIKGVTWEVTPGAVFYCRSALSSELGVSEPGEVAPLFETWDAVLDTARAVNESSGGTRNLFSCPSDVTDAYILGRSDPWIDSDGSITTPDYMADYLDFMDALTGEELTFDCSRWSSQWTSRISNRTAAAYFGTMRFGELFLRTYHSGDWGVVRPPQDYYDGGSFIFVTSYCDMDASAARFIRDLTINEDNLYDMAEDGMTVNNISVMMNCAQDDSYCESWLNGQNPFKVFSQVAWGIDASRVTPYDDMINEEFRAMASSYLNGNYDSTEQAIEAFEQAVQEELQ